MAEAPLSSLCSICFTNPPKYRCPRCPGAVRTCSLPCYKTHQQRASCNGQRDPTTYVKKSALATAAGIDHDYNFLSGIERAIARPETLSPAKSSTPAKPSPAISIATEIQTTSLAEKKRWNTDGSLMRYLRENRIHIERAPLGMTRQKENATRYLPKSKRIMWSLEWMDESSIRKGVSEALESTTVGDAYAAFLAAGTRKRKRAEEAEDDSRTANTDTSTQPPVQVDATPTQEAEQTHHFYLHTPLCSSRVPVLAPVSADQKLTSILHERTVLEYPTLYVLSCPPTELPDTFLNEAKYKADMDSKRGSIVVAEPAKLQKTRYVRVEEAEKEEEDLDPSAVLEMLRRDVHG